MCDSHGFRESETHKDESSSDTEELSVGGVSPKREIETDECDESHSTSDLLRVSPLGGNLKFSIDNILDPNFGRVPITPQQILDLLPKNPIYNQNLVAKTQSKISLWRPGIEPEEPKTEKSKPIDLSVKEESRSLSEKSEKKQIWPAWVYCTRYSDRPSSGRSPRCRRPKRKKSDSPDSKRPRTAFSAEQLSRLKVEFNENRYLTEKRRHDLAQELGLQDNQIKIWFQNKRAKMKKASGHKNALALQLMAEGLYNHSTIQVDDPDDDDDDDDS